jgi:hypothetical protein
MAPEPSRRRNLKPGISSQSRWALLSRFNSAAIETAGISTYRLAEVAPLRCASQIVGTVRFSAGAISDWRSMNSIDREISHGRQTPICLALDFAVINR